VDALRRCGKLVYLTAPPEVLWERIFKDVHRHATRLKIDPGTGLQQVRQTLSVREPLYTQAADCIVDTTGRSVASIVERVITRAGLRHA
jgi:shikimate kinase